MWEIKRAFFGTKALEDLLNEGWEPFAIGHSAWSTDVVYVRRKNVVEYKKETDKDVPF